MRPLLASGLVVVRVVMLVEMRSLYAMSDCFYLVSPSHIDNKVTSAQLESQSSGKEGKRTERAVRFRMIVDGTVLAPLHTGLLNRRLASLVSDVHGCSKNAK